MKAFPVGVSCPAIFQAAFSWSDWVGLPYVDCGRGPDAFDCWGLVMAVQWAGRGVRLPSFLTYDRVIIDGDSSRAIANTKSLECWELVPVKEAHPFDVVVLNIGDNPNHVGVVIDSRLFLHSAREQASMIEPYTGRRWKNRVEGVYRYHS